MLPSLLKIGIIFRSNTNYFEYLFSDIDECKTNPCSQYASCLNTNGSYVCTCINGYTGDGNNCTGKMKFIFLISLKVLLNLSKYLEIKLDFLFPSPLAEPNEKQYRFFFYIFQRFSKVFLKVFIKVFPYQQFPLNINIYI